LVFAGSFVVRTLWHGGRLAQRERSRGLQWCSRRTLQVFAVTYEAHGPPPCAGRLVCSHLSYLDALVLVALIPAVFVSKSEVKHWPDFGRFTRLAGTLFVDRTRRREVTRMNAEIQRALDGGSEVVLFPEGSSMEWKGDLAVQVHLA
jgi:1-acyl-sn-glycerol-3-phosphate acyltransferase